ncbi:MAG: SdpA family antimicrobial peptide system protein [Flavobacteriaceae bacterium]|nr:SdpA family antimicrobial peptide system protein [Flavobacteriaceae bacterium]MCY4267631.1 SdpA family antimicrobial peptide system protein [Flavobacteriaceae bacterium]
MKRLTLVIWLFAGVFVFIASFKHQIILGKSVKRQINYVFPEGWGFFTKDPRSLMMNIYRIEKGNINEINVSNHSWSNSLGFSRRARIIGFEASMIVSDIPKKLWIEDKSKNIKSHIYDSVLIVKSNPYYKHITKGDFIFMIYKQIPYAWVNKSQEKFKPADFIRVRIE